MRKWVTAAHSSLWSGDYKALMEKKPQAGATELSHVPAASSPSGEPAPTEALQGMGFLNTPLIQLKPPVSMLTSPA